MCGKPVPRRGIALTCGCFCSEACYLGSHAATTDAASSVQVETALAEALVSALDLREHETALHSKRVACHTLVLARRSSHSTAAFLRQVYWGALLHDIGKIGIPDTVLLKQGSLTQDEWTLMRTHPEKGYFIVSKMPGMQGAADIVLSHEERFDGSGYPRGLKGEAIPLGARLFAVIDTLDAMTTDRPYRQALSFDAAKLEIARMAGVQFDPVAVAVFVEAESILRDMVAIKCEKASNKFDASISTGG